MKKILIFAASMCFALVSVHAQSAFTTKVANFETRAALPMASFEAEAHSFGQIPQGIPVSHTFTFVNHGQGDLEIKAVQPTCGCTATDYTKTPIKPGHEGFITVSYDAKAKGVFTKSVVVRTNEAHATRTLRFTGETVEQ